MFFFGGGGATGIKCPEGIFLNVLFNPNTGVFINKGVLNKTALSLVEHFRQTYEWTNESTVLWGWG